MYPRVWNTSRNGLIQYVSLTKPKLDEALQVLRSSFFKYESTCKAVGLSEDPEAIRELDELVINAAKDGLSLVAEEKSSGRVIGCAINNINVKDSKGLFKQYNFKHVPARHYMEVNTAIEDAMNIFGTLRCNCFIENLFTGILPEFRGEGVARIMQKSTVDLLQCLVNGENVKVPIDKNPLARHPLPTVTLGVVTSSTIIKVLSELEYRPGADFDIHKVLKDTSLPASIASKHPPVTLYYRYIKKS